MEIKRNKKNNTISISQSTYISNIAEKFGVTDSYPITTPMESTYKATANDNKDSKNRAENMDNYFVTIIICNNL